MLFVTRFSNEKMLVKRRRKHALLQDIAKENGDVYKFWSNTREVKNIPALSKGCQASVQLITEFDELAK